MNLVDKFSPVLILTWGLFMLPRGSCAGGIGGKMWRVLDQVVETAHPPEIELHAWMTNGLVYRSRASNIAISFSDMKGSWASYFVGNIYTYDPWQKHDYFCIPDDLIIAYDEHDVFWTRAGALNWNMLHGRAQKRGTAFLCYAYEEQSGFHPLVEALSRKHGCGMGWNAIPASISVRLDMAAIENYVPMTITIRNTHDNPLHFVYALQDGAWMTEGEPHQRGVRQYWPDGTNDRPRCHLLDYSRSEGDWFGMYNDRNGGMFAGTYAPPESKGVRCFATLSSLSTCSASYLDGSGFDPGADDEAFVGGIAAVDPPTNNWPRLEGILGNISFSADVKFDDMAYKIGCTVVDFGVIPPGEERVQVVVKIMLTGYHDRKDMRAKIDRIISRIPRYDIPTYALDKR